ncbi:alginate O-acetyltransferase [Rhizobium sp. NRK18]|uniref:alginate O-acetyltransferase n=1 Tax=Rhizobium sp. NRK18 TaxID=2964667 RepID=UPI0021C3F058|nr:alginate O-acetyltransferase [Rhizobium sp. NRK18]MCQ2005932.1 alginate O-acetyltransferase [Rhizobium sp. NRK18]
MVKISKTYVNALLPAVFFGYAIYANADLLMTPPKEEDSKPLSVSYFVDGDATKDMDHLYKTSLPHREVAIGVVGAARYALLGAGRDGVVVGKDGWLFTEEEFRPISEADIEDAVARIAEVRDELRAAGSELVVVPIPAKADVYAEHLGTIMSGDAIRNAYGTFNTSLKAAGITTVDSRQALIADKEKAGVFLQSDTHWTPDGAQVVAGAIGQAVNGAGLDFAKEEVKGKTEKPVEFWGDLTKFITSPDYAATAGLKQEKVPLFRAELQKEDAATDIFGSDDAGVPVVLVGTSYSANENWSFQDFLEMSMSTDVLNLAKEGMGPGVPMLDFLKSDTFKSTPPQLVIWEFPVRYLSQDILWKRADEPASASVAPDPTKGGKNA